MSVQMEIDAVCLEFIFEESILVLKEKVNSYVCICHKFSEHGDYMYL